MNCKYPNCDFKAKDRGNMNYHYEVFHLNKKTYNGIFCNHQNCKISIKTERQKINHHNNLDNECRFEKMYLIYLIGSFKRCVNNMLNNITINDNNLTYTKDHLISNRSNISNIKIFDLYENKNENFRCLKSFYKYIEKSLFDTDYFYYVLGETFESSPTELSY